MARPHAPAVARAIFDRLDEQHPNADTELHYRTPFELLVATILSAQSTDERVNLVTPALFARYPDARALAAAEPPDIEPLVIQTGFFRQKSKAVIGMARALVERHDGEVPASMEALVELPGVGRKTANVVLGHALGVPGLPVDRHVLRVSNRIGLATSDDPEAVEQQLCAVTPRERWTRVSDTLILHGRRVCRPTPRCERCAVRDYCRYYLSLASDTSAAPVRAASQKRPPSPQPPRAASPSGRRRIGGEPEQAPTPAVRPAVRKRGSRR